MFHAHDAKPCSQCKTAAPMKGQRMCSGCKVAYMKEWRPKNQKSMEDRAFTRGALAMRKSIEDKFTNICRGEMNGLMAADVARNVPLPDPTA